MTNEDRLADLLVAWESAASRGETPTIENHCRDHPDLADEFRRVLVRLSPVDAVLAGTSGDIAAVPAGELGRYRPLRFHARGGLGAVFVAEDRELNRAVALKGMQPLAALDPDARRRFLAEAEVTTRLEHPGVVPVYGLVTDPGGTPYYAMRFVRGATLADEIGRYRATPAPAELRRLLRHFVAVCQTVAYAHNRGVLHRDLKPDNVMIGEFGETVLLDWGLAKFVGRPDPDATVDHGSSPLSPAAGAETQQGAVKGAPAYMSPEQARGEWDRVGPATDVYGLGATLYVLLTGRRPHEGYTVTEVLAKAREGRVRPPRTIDPTVPKALDAVCRKATAAQPEDRYATALDLAQDVERWLADEPLSAWREPLLVRARRWANRHRTLVATAAAAVLVGAVALAVASERLNRANRDLDAANRRLDDANRNLEQRNTDLAAALKGEREARALADERRTRMRLLFRDSVASTWWAPITRRDSASAEAQFEFLATLASNYEAAVRADGGAAGDLAFLNLMRLRGGTLSLTYPRELQKVLAELRDASKADPSNEWLAIWHGMARREFGAFLMDSGNPQFARQELLSVRNAFADPAAHRRPEAALLLGEVTNQLYRLAELTVGVQHVARGATKTELTGWIAAALAALGSGPPAGVTGGMADNWVFLRAQLSHYRNWLTFADDHSPRAHAAFRELAAEVAVDRRRVRNTHVNTQMAILEARLRRIPALWESETRTGSPEGPLAELDLALSLLTERLKHGAFGATFNAELVSEQLAYLAGANNWMASIDLSDPALAPRVVAVCEKVLAILSDAERAPERTPLLRRAFPKHTEASFRRLWEGSKEQAEALISKKPG